MAKTTTSNISIRMDSNLKAAAEALYEELGMNISTAFNIFVRQSLRERGIPFKITEGSPNKETVSAMQTWSAGLVLKAVTATIRYIHNTI